MIKKNVKKIVKDTLESSKTIVMTMLDEAINNQNFPEKDRQERNLFQKM